MKKLLIILGFVTSILAVILAVTPLFKLALLPMVLAIICGALILFYTKKDPKKPKPVQYIFLLVIICLSLTVYKSIFTITEVENVEELEKLEEKSEEDAIELLDDLDIED